jgi:hypothetical protein
LIRKAEAIVLHEAIPKKENRLRVFQIRVQVLA